jgi:uncharacterized protein (TIGR03435 family)
VRFPVPRSIYDNPVSQPLSERTYYITSMTVRYLLALVACAAVHFVAAGALAPYWIVFAQRLEFEVASVKHTPNVGPFGSAPRRSGDSFTMHNAHLYTIIYYAYHLRGNYQLVGDLVDGSDGWNSFDIDARVGHDATDDQVRLMVQALLADRFDLKLHREMRDLPEYLVTIAKGGPKLRPASEQPMEARIEDRHFSQPKSACTVSAWQEGDHLTCHAATIEQILAYPDLVRKIESRQPEALCALCDHLMGYSPRQLIRVAERARSNVKPTTQTMTHWRVESSYQLNTRTPLMTDVETEILLDGSTNRSQAATCFGPRANFRWWRDRRSRRWSSYR